MKQTILFYIFALLIIVSAILTVRMRNIFHAGLFLILTFVGVAGLYITLDAEFIAGVQVLIYVGAIAILILFAVMLTQGIYDKTQAATNKQQFGALVLSVILLVLLVLIIMATEWITGNQAAPSISELAIDLMRKFALPFEIVSVVLLAALLGAVVIARKEEK